MRLLSIAVVLLGLVWSPSADAKKKKKTPTVELINLYDAFGKNSEGTEESFGFSTLVRVGDTTILFDAGTSSDILERNAAALGVDLAEVDYAVASHAHADHTGGFDALRRANPEAKIYMPNDFMGLGGELTFSAAGPEPEAGQELPEHMRYFDGEHTTAHLVTDGRFYKSVEYVKGHTELAPGVRLVATTSTNMGYFTRYPGVDIHGNPAEGDAKFLGLPELSLAIDTPEGQVLIVGCSHSGVEAIVTAAKTQSEAPIALLAGGFHLIPYDRETLSDLVGRLKDQGVQQVAPAHCSGHLGFLVLSEAYGDDFHFFGLGEHVER